MEIPPRPPDRTDEQIEADLSRIARRLPDTAGFERRLLEQVLITLTTWLEQD